MLLTVAVMSSLAQRAVHLAVQTGSLEHRGSVGVYTAITAALDLYRSIAG